MKTFYSYLVGIFACVLLMLLSPAAFSKTAPNIYYTYHFSNTAAVPVQVSFLDEIPSGLYWDSGFARVLTHPVGSVVGDANDLDELIADVSYVSGGKSALVDALRIPPGKSSMTLRTQATEMVGTIENGATIAFGNGTKLTIEAMASVTLTAPQPFTTAFANSGVAGFSVLVTGSDFVMGGSKTTIQNDLAIAEGVVQAVTEGIVKGDYFVHPPAQGTVNLSKVKGTPAVAVLQDLSKLKEEALRLSEQAALLTPTQKLSVNSATEVVASAANGINVLLIDDIKLTSFDQLTLTGTSNDYFVLNIQNSVSFQGHAKVVLNGINPDHVIFNLLPGATDFQVTGQGEFVGAILAVQPGNHVKIAGGSVFQASIASHSVSLSGNSTIGDYRFK